MTRHPQKSDFPVSQVRRYLEPGPIVLVSSQWQGKTNIMTLGWHTVLEFSPSLVGCMISGSNHSFQMIRNSRECVINLPTTALTVRTEAWGKIAVLADPFGHGLAGVMARQTSSSFSTSWRSKRSRADLVAMLDQV